MRVVAAALLITLGGLAMASPQPGDVFREYVWRPGDRDGSWQRVTGPDAEAEGAQDFLPNAVNRIEIGDLDGAVRIEAQLEQWGGHAGTGYKRMRVNGGEWLDVPEPAGIPGGTGQGGPSINYQYFAYPTVALPLGTLREGENTFEFLCSSGKDLGGVWLGHWWPQWGVYGVTFRVYYGPAKPRPTGRMTSPEAGGALGDGALLEAEADGPAGVARVEFVALCEDFDQDGDGVFRGWQARHRYGALRGHVGTADGAPYRVTWDLAWLPDQAEPVALAARIVGADGIVYVTPAIEDVRIERGYAVRMHAPSSVPVQWQTRAGNRHECTWEIDGDLSDVTDAQVILATWNGDQCDSITVNGHRLAGKVGRNHNYGYDVLPVPVEFLRPGANTFSTWSETEHHGIEVMWPGPVLKLRGARAR